MKTILIVAASALCLLSANADDDYATIVEFLGEHGHILISPDDVAKVQALMKANGYKHVWEIPKSAAAAFDSPSAAPTPAEAAPSGASVTNIIVPSGTPRSEDRPVAVQTPDADLNAGMKTLIAQQIDNNYLAKEYQIADLMDYGRLGPWNPSDPVKVQIALQQAWEDVWHEQQQTEDRYEVLIKRATSYEEKNRLEQEKSFKLKVTQEQLDDITLKLTGKH
jgi:hypothetical protein